MAPREKLSSSTLPGLWKYPTYRDSYINSGEVWLKGKQVDDGAEGLWRIHDDLYDLSRWINNHPGGSEWLRMTKGTDITEAFESYHIFETAERLLPLFYARRATTIRNSPSTFNPNGFYHTLKGRVREVLMKSPTGPTTQCTMIADILVVSVIVTAILAVVSSSYTMGTLSGVLLALSTNCAHNFFHQKDNFRMFYFDLSLLSSRDWRISHGLSHHAYPNSVLDLEVSMVEPWMYYLPINKSFWERYGSWFYSSIVYSFIFISQLVLRLVVAANGHVNVLRWSDLIPLALPVTMKLVTGCGVVDALLMWSWIILVSSFVFGVIGTSAGHHHPEVFHDGDAARVDRDWGLQQLDAVRDRKEISASLFLVLTNYGDHSLHHMFPSVDHSRLNMLYPVLKQTCDEFGIDYEVGHTSSVIECFKGQFQQLARTKPNRIAPVAERSDVDS